MVYLFDSLFYEIDDDIWMFLAVGVRQFRQSVDDRLRVHLQVRQSVAVSLGNLDLGRGPRRRKLHFYVGFWSIIKNVFFDEKGKKTFLRLFHCLSERQRMQWSCIVFVLDDNLDLLKGFFSQNLMIFLPLNENCTLATLLRLKGISKWLITHFSLNNNLFFTRSRHSKNRPTYYSLQN